jgi:hypothetical protein
MSLIKKTYFDSVSVLLATSDPDALPSDTTYNLKISYHNYTPHGSCNHSPNRQLCLWQWGVRIHHQQSPP